MAVLPREVCGSVQVHRKQQLSHTSTAVHPSYWTILTWLQLWNQKTEHIPALPSMHRFQWTHLGTPKSCSCVFGHISTFLIPSLTFASFYCLKSYLRLFPDPFVDNILLEQHQKSLYMTPKFSLSWPKDLILGTASHSPPPGWISYCYVKCRKPIPYPSSFPWLTNKSTLLASLFPGTQAKNPGPSLDLS